MRSLAALQEYPSSTASTQTAAASNSSSGSYYPFFRLPWHYMHVVYRHICKQNTHTHKSNFYSKNLNRKICFIAWIQQCHLVSFIQIWKQTQSHDFLSEAQAVPREVNNMTGWEFYQWELWNYFIKARPLLKALTNGTYSRELAMLKHDFTGLNSMRWAPVKALETVDSGLHSWKRWKASSLSPWKGEIHAQNTKIPVMRNAYQN